MAKSKDKNEVANKLKNIINLIGKLNKKEQDAFIKWAEVMFYKDDSVVYDYFEKNLKREAKKDMALIDLIPGAIEIFRDEGRAEGHAAGKLEGHKAGKIEGHRLGIIEGERLGERKSKISSLKRLLTKKLNSEPSKKIVLRLENMTIGELEAIEDKIFEIENWDEV